MGQLLTQMATLRGARVIGTVSTEEKVAPARAAGADEVLLYEDFAENVRKLTDGVGVAAVYDGIGADTFDGSLASLRQRGTLLVIGTASGPTPPLDIPRLNAGGSLYVTRPSIAHYAASTGELRRRTDEVFQWVQDGRVKVSIGGRFSLEEARAAHEALESRSTSGKLILRP